MKGGSSVLADDAGGDRTGATAVNLLTGSHDDPAAVRGQQAQARLRRGMYLLPSLFTAGNIGAGYSSITQTIEAIGPTAMRTRIWTGRRLRSCLRFRSTRWTGASRA